MLLFGEAVSEKAGSLSIRNVVRGLNVVRQCGNEGRPALPVTTHTEALIVGREIWHNPRTNEFILTDPASHIPVAQFPADIRLSVYAHVYGRAWLIPAYVRASCH